MKNGFALLIFVFLFGTAQAAITQQDPDLTKNEWVLASLSDGYYVAETSEGVLLIIKEGTVAIVHIITYDEHEWLSCARGTIAQSVITGTKVSLRKNPYGEVEASTANVLINLSEANVFDEMHQDNSPYEYNWGDVRTAADICRSVTQSVEEEMQPQEVRAPTH